MVYVNLISKKSGEVNRFLSSFYNTDFGLESDSNWGKSFLNPIEIAEIVGTYADNFEDYSLDMWISLDKNVFICITDKNADDIIRYLYERFPY